MAQTVFARYRFMVMFAGCLLALGAPGWAKTMYVTDSFQITVRAGKGTEYKILQMLSSGTPVKLLVQENDWCQVELNNGKKGWVLCRYLIEAPPKSIIIDQLTLQLDSHQQRLAKIMEENASLKQSNEELLKQVKTYKTNWETAQKNYDDLLSGSKEYLDMKQKYETLKAEQELLSAKLQALQQENEELRQKSGLYWFLSGALVLLVGLIVGISMGRLQRKRRLYI